MSQFIEQVQILMHAQQIKCYAQNIFAEKSNSYMWLFTRRSALIFMSTRHEFCIRQALTKICLEQQVKIMKQLLTWLDDNPDVPCLKIPEMCLSLLQGAEVENLLNLKSSGNRPPKHSSFGNRVGSMRSSFTRISGLIRRSNSNANGNSGLLAPPQLDETPRRSVTFNDVPVIYKIS